jgi:hypothetical protein
MVITTSLVVSIVAWILGCHHVQGFTRMQPFYGGRRMVHVRNGRDHEPFPQEPANEEESTPKQETLKNSPPPTTDWMRALGTSPRRIFLSVASASSIALLGNLGGLTSNLLSLVPEDTVETTGLDIYYPRNGSKRIRTNEYTFCIPQEWLADTSLELAKAHMRTQSLDYTMSNAPQRRAQGTIPDCGT